MCIVHNLIETEYHKYLLEGLLHCKIISATLANNGEDIPRDTKLFKKSKYI